MYMSGESLLIILVVGIIAEWLSGQIVQGTGFGIVGDLLIEIVGTFIGSWATFGALVLLLISGSFAVEAEGSGRLPASCAPNALAPSPTRAPLWMSGWHCRIGQE